MAGIALGVAILHDSAHAQIAGCIVMEVSADQEPLKHEMPLPPIKRVKEKAQKHQLPPALADEAETRPSTRETAFASGQSLADYCGLKVQPEDNR
jgi:hypothetical protein